MLRTFDFGITCGTEITTGTESISQTQGSERRKLPSDDREVVGTNHSARPRHLFFEAKKLLTQVVGNEDMFKYILHHMTFESESSKVMCMDKVFVDLVNEYYVTGKGKVVRRQATCEDCR